MPESEKPGSNEEQECTPVVVGDWAPGSSSESTPAWGEAVPAETAPSEPTAVERPRDELLVGVAAVMLAGSVFLPWYKGLAGRTTVSGWASANLGPIVFFLALAAVAIVVLRRLRVPIAFPVDHSLILEGIGWASVLAALAKRFFILPSVLGFPLTADKGLFVSMFAAVGVALLGGRVSSGAAFVVRPGWHKSAGGKTGVAVLGVALAAGVAFGLTNSPEPKREKPATGGASPFSSPASGVPACAKAARFPIPGGVTDVKGLQHDREAGAEYCVVLASSKLSLKSLVARYEAALKKNGWKFTKVPNQYASGSLGLTAPRCGQLTFEDRSTPGTWTISAFFSPCGQFGNSGD